MRTVLTHPDAGTGLAAAIRLLGASRDAAGGPHAEPLRTAPPRRAILADTATEAGVSTVQALGPVIWLAAASAAAAGLDGDLIIPILPGRDRGGTAVFPGYGTAVSAASAAELGLEIRNGSLRLHADGIRWRLPHRLTAWHGGQQLTVDLHAVDPYHSFGRSTGGTAPSRAEVRRWTALLARAWQLLVTRLPLRAAELSCGLRTLVPLAGAAGAASATARNAFGAVATTEPPAAPALARALVHEFSHSKLNAVLDLIPLLVPADGAARRYYSPWRADPRPAAGVLHGAYAFLSVADVWRVSDDAARAGYQLARTREQVDRALRGLADTDALTGAGRRFVAGMRDSLDSTGDHPIPRSTSAEATVDNLVHEIVWRIRHDPPDDGAVARLAARRASASAGTSDTDDPGVEADDWARQLIAAAGVSAARAMLDRVPDLYVAYRRLGRGGRPRPEVADFLAGTVPPARPGPPVA